MSVAELKQAVDALSVDERLELAEYLRHTAKANDPQWQAEISQRLDECLLGKGHSANELLVLHEQLSKSGR